MSERMERVEATTMRETYKFVIVGIEVYLSFHPNLRASDFAPGNSDNFISLAYWVARNGGNQASFFVYEGRFYADVMKSSNPMAGCSAAMGIGRVKWHFPTWNRKYWELLPEDVDF